MIMQSDNHAILTLDSMGRVVIPKSVRMRWNIGPGSQVDLLRTGEEVAELRPVTLERRCTVCGSTIDLLECNNGKCLCTGCACDLLSLLKNGRDA